MSRKFVSRERSQFVEEVDCVGQKLENAVANEPGVELEKPRQGCCESYMLLSKCLLVLLILHPFSFLYPFHVLVVPLSQISTCSPKLSKICFIALQFFFSRT